MRLVAAACAALLLAGCSNGSPTATPAPSPSVTTPSASRAPSPGATATASPARGVTVVVVPPVFTGGFTTPSGNVACDIAPDFVRCDAKDRPWSELPRTECGGPAEWRTRLVLQERGAKLRGECGYGRPSGGPPLAYGTRLDLGRARCLSERTGLTCWIAGTRAGFAVSRSAYSTSARPPAAAAAATPPPARPGSVLEVPRGFHGGFRIGEYQIVCEIGDAMAHCLVPGATWEPPPPRDPCTDGDESTEVILQNGRGRAFEECRTDTLDGGLLLAPGHGVRVGDVRCDATKDAVECRNAATRHGFVVSPKAFRGY
ncbi:MAG TPA: hypothetical protein VGX28_11360 [Frankiaceae bacterium]|nr:hypothetical protein [Frankiaceae bacterium]